MTTKPIRDDTENDDDYHRYLWGESSAKGFAKNALHRTAPSRKRPSRPVERLTVSIGAPTDLSEYK